MALIDVIKFEAPDDSVFVWKYPSEDLKIGSQLTVNEGQTAVFVKGGQALDVFYPGTHTLVTGNIPLLNKIINLPFGGNTPFSAEVWYVNTTVKRDMKWGTKTPIPLMDPTLGFPVTARAFGKWGVRISDPRSFLTQVVGSQQLGDDEKIHAYFIGEIIQNVISQIGEAVAGGKASILQVAALLSSLSKSAAQSITPEFEQYGLELVSFNIESINIPDDEMTRIQDVFAKTLEVRELSKVQAGGAYAQVKSFEVLGDAASNTGSNAFGGLLGAGIGLGVGLPVGQQLGQQLTASQPSQSESGNASVAATSGGADVASRIRKLKEMLADGLITEEIFNTKRDEVLKDL